MSKAQAGRQRASNLVVINWNGDQDLIDCLDSLQAAKTDLSQGYDVLVLDNASTTGAIGRIEVEYPWVECLKLSRNRYWAGGNNAAVQCALERDYEWIVLSNSDIVVGESWYPALQENGRSDEIGAVGFKILVKPEGSRSRSSTTTTRLSICAIWPGTMTFICPGASWP